MKNKIIFLLKGIIFLCIFVGLMLVLGKFFFSRSYLYCWTSYEAVSELPKNSVDVILAGTSAMQNSVLNLEMYKDTNLKVLSIASSGEPLELTYAKLKEMYKYQSPKVVVLDIYYQHVDFSKPNIREDKLIQDLQKQYMHYCMDITDLSFNKLKVIDEIVWDEYKLSYVFPILTYHSTWKKMDSEQKEDNEEFKLLNPILKNSKSYNSLCTPYENGTDKKELAYRIRETNKEEIMSVNSYYARVNEYLYKIIDLVTEKGSTIVLMTAPKVDCETELIASRLLELDVGESEQVKFFNSIYEVEDFDFTTDLRDYWHVNYNGAKKVTKALKEYLIKELKLKPNNFSEDNIIWEEAYEEYVEFMLKEESIDVLN